MNRIPRPIDPIRVIFATDNSYAQHLAVTILSLIENNPQEILDLRIIAVSLSEKHQTHLRDVVHGKSSVTLQFIELDEKLLAQFPISGHIKSAAYGRILIEKLVEPELSKILYLDCDLYIAESIRPLWETDISRYALGGVNIAGLGRREALGIPHHLPYVNSGVLLINLDYWRSQNITVSLLDFISKNYAILEFHDQDTLNGVLYHQTYLLDQKWNADHHIFEDTAEQLGLTSPELRQLRKKPGIVHFTSDRKPWQLLNRHPYRKNYWHLLKTTPYRNYRPPLFSAYKSLPNHLRFGRLRFLFSRKRGGKRIATA